MSQIFVINLDISTERLEFQERQFQQLGLSFTRVPAMNAHNIDQTELNQRQTHGPKRMSASEIACLLSHAKCWRHVVELNRPALILEDDAVISKDLPKALKHILERAQDSVVQLESYLSRPKYLYRASEMRLPLAPFKFERLLKDSPGAAGYVVGPVAARNLLRSLESQTYIADTYLGLFSGVPHYQLNPAMVVQLQFTHPSQEANAGYHSSIYGDENGRARFRQKLRRLWLETYVAYLKLKAFLIGTKKDVPVCPSIL